MAHLSTKTVALIVAHPDDETLWAGGTILCHAAWDCFVVCLCRASDKRRASRFYKALKVLRSTGTMGDLDDGPDQNPLDEGMLQRTILHLLPSKHFDLLITHNPKGEYTRHLRHEETGKAVIGLWQTGKIDAEALWIFAYEDGNKAYTPKAMDKAVPYPLSGRIWRKKYSLITKTYGFSKDSWEAKTTPKTEAFCQFVKSYGPQPNTEPPIPQID